MNRQERIRFHVDAIAEEIYGYMSENSSAYDEGWIPATTIKEDLNLKFSEYPQNKNESPKGWLFGIAARRLEDMNMIDYDNSKSRTFCRVRKTENET